MKLFKISLFLVFCTLFTTVQAQNLSIEYQQVSYEDTDFPAVHVVLHPSPNKVKQAFKDFMKDKYDVKMKGIGFLSNKDVLSAEQVNISAITDKTIDFRAKIVEDNDQTHLDIFGSFGYDLSISKEDYPTAYRNMRNIVLEFINEFLPNYYQERIDQTQEQISDLNKDIEGYEQDYQNNLDKITKLKKDNEDLKKELEMANSALENAKKTLENRRNKLQNVNQTLQETN